MTEEEKKRIALEIMAQEMNRSPVSHFLDPQSMRAGSIIRKVEKQQAAYASLAQQGITWQKLKKVYDESVEQGKRDMIDFRMTFFYASTPSRYMSCSVCLGMESCPFLKDSLWSWVKTDHCRALSERQKKKPVWMSVTLICRPNP